ncbi:MAG: sulfite exporter TauE/SafE family protein [Aromatoleum sp.]|nr:sulfite exporter TauE/SafE family protein [Aromatoleum sp.]
MPESALIGALLAGLLGGLHCFAMCGGWLALVGRPPAVAPLQPQRSLRFGQAASHAGRLTTYVVLGALFGAAGGAAFAVSVAPLQRTLYAVANLLLLVLAFSIAVRGIQFGGLERAGLAVFRRLMPAVTRVAPGGGIAGRYVLGLVWGFTPCALVYSVLPVALLAGGAGEGALVMFAFGIGTLPNLLAAGWTLARSRRLFTRAAYRYAAAFIVATFAVAGLYRAWFVPEALGQGPFCLFR